MTGGGKKHSDGLLPNRIWSQVFPEWAPELRSWIWGILLCSIMLETKMQQTGTSLKILTKAGAWVQSQHCRGSGLFETVAFKFSWSFEGLLSGSFLLIEPVRLPECICLNVNKACPACFCSLRFQMPWNLGAAKLLKRRFNVQDETDPNAFPEFLKTSTSPFILYPFFFLHTASIPHVFALKKGKSFKHVRGFIKHRAAERKLKSYLSKTFFFF